MPNFLVIEDNPVDSRLFHEILSNAYPDGRVFLAETGEEGFRVLQEQEIDLLILDVYLEDQRTLEVLARIRGRSTILPILLTSSFKNEQDRARGLELGATDFISKPIFAEEVIARVAVQLHLRQVIDDAEWASRKTNEGIKLLYKELQKRNARLLELSALKDEFISKVSHELRTPMTIIRESISQIVDGVLGDVPPDQHRYLEKALNGIDHLGQMIDDLLDIAKIEKGKLHIDRVEMNLVELICAVVDTFQMKARAKGVGLRTDIADNELMLFADAGRIHQVLTNLVNNALKFTKEGCITVGARSRDGGVECFVQDTGCGISSEDQPRLFKKFEQIGRVEGPGEKGTGLGLVISKELIEMHGGTIHVKSAPGEGSRFVFVLPSTPPGDADGDAPA